jgi:trehalose 6-phosphate phosphatase
MEFLPRISQDTALFLDFDGTLTELAPRPDAVQIAPDLVATLAALATRLEGALAIVTGRPLHEIDAFLAPLRPSLAAEHGAVLRFPDGHGEAAPRPDLAAVVQAARALADAHPELLVEEKSAAMALHYRAAPQLGPLCLETLERVLAGRSGLQLLHGKRVIEVKPAGVDKGRAIAALMARSPFLGRRPLFVGDDVTDEAGFASVQAMGGDTVKVAEGATIAEHRCESPAQVRAWLRTAAGGDFPTAAGRGQQTLRNMR